MDFKVQLAQQILENLETVYGDSCGLDNNSILSLIEVPPDTAMGDYAFPCFRLAKALRKAPLMIANQLKDAFHADFLQSVEAVGGYLNFFIDKATYAKTIINAVLNSGERYGATNEGAGKVICIDYSSINIAKRFHIGHLSTTVIGNALYKMYSFLGYKCVGINHLGDWGTQFGKMICAYLNWGNKADVESGGVNALVDLYVRFHEEAEENPQLEDDGRAWFKKIEDGDPKALELFNWFKEVTMLDVARVYDLLGITFDSYAGESFYNDKMDRVIDELRAKELLVESQGAYIVNLEAEKMPPCLLLKKDGATLYTTRDIAAALYRKDTYHFDKCLYVVAYQQNLHFQQWFKVVEKMGYSWAKDLIHVAFGMVSFEGQALATRKGHVVYLDDLLTQAVEKARAIIEEKSPNLLNKDDTARKVGIGSAIFFALSNNRIKDIDFWWDRALNFDGETGPYVQYTHARCCSVLTKAQGMDSTNADYSALSDSEAQDVVRYIEQFPRTIAEAVLRNEPSMVARHIVDVAQTYNKFYYEHRIIDAEDMTRAARLQLTIAVKQVIAIGLNLIGMEAPEKM